VAEVCKSIFRKSDLCGRIGGEEFLIMLPHTDIDGAMIITERLATLINQRIVYYNDQTIKVTISAGVSQIKTEDQQLDDWIKHVDDLMYLAKRRGRNQVVSTE
jgi:diguanylate cyclase (GGDEF)-like protein